MKKIQIVHQSLIHALVDDEDFKFLNQFRWYLKVSHSGCNFYARTEIAKVAVYMHQLLMPNPPDGCTVDHQDRNGLNNQRHNLRYLTQIQQNLNKPLRKKYAGGKRSKYKGVYWESRTDKWFASITFKNKSRNLGTYINEIDAARAYNKAALQLHGEHAVLNEFNEPLTEKEKV